MYAFNVSVDHPDGSLAVSPPPAGVDPTVITPPYPLARLDSHAPKPPDPIPNAKAGIFWELSYQGLIEDNVATGNAGFGNIYVSNSLGTSADPIVVLRNEVGSNQLGNSIAMQGDGNRVVLLGFVSIRDNIVEGKIVLNLLNGHPSPPGIVVTGNQKPNGTPVGLG